MDQEELLAEAMDGTYRQFIELTAWPENVEEIGRERLLAVWRFTAQPLTYLRTSVFTKITALLSTVGGSWTEKEWKELVITLRTGSVEERSRLAELMCRHLAGSRPALLDCLMRELYAPLVDISSEGSEAQFEPPCLTSAVADGSVTVEATAKARRPRKIRKVEEKVVELPTTVRGRRTEVKQTCQTVMYEVLNQKIPLNRILSFLNQTSRKELRLVSRLWNDTILADIYRNQALSVSKCTEDEKYSNLSTVDVRILSQINICVNEEDTKKLETIFLHIRSNGILERLRFLGMSWFDGKCLDAFIQVVNGGGFMLLEELDIFVDFCQLEKDNYDKYKCKNKVQPNALPSL